MSDEYEVYVLLTDTGTLLTKTIKWFTKDPLNHASIAFDRELTQVYSFGRKNPSNPFFAGFVKEDMNGDFFRDATCAVYSCKVTAQEYDNIRNQILHMELNHDQYKYNLIGMFGLLLNIQIKRDKTYFCSQFVATVFETSGVRLVNKCSSFATPGDFVHTSQLELIYAGDLRPYVIPSKLPFKRTVTA
ncbi:hypothetical protein [Paenibacillus sp. CMAA1364]